MEILIAVFLPPLLLIFVIKTSILLKLNCDHFFMNPGQRKKKKIILISLRFIPSSSKSKIKYSGTSTMKGSTYEIFRLKPPPNGISAFYMIQKS